MTTVFQEESPFFGTFSSVANTTTVQATSGTPISSIFASPPSTTALESPSSSEEPLELDENGYPLFPGGDPVGMVMDMLNFTVVPKKPESIFETPLPPGDMMPKSHYIEEKKALHELIKGQRQEIVKAQVDRLNQELKTKDLEDKLQKVARVVGEIHQLYGRFLRSIVDMMQSKDREVVIGPFENNVEAQKVFRLLTRVTSQFESEVGSLKDARAVLGVVTEYLEQKARQIFEQGQGASHPPVVIIEEDEAPGGETLTINQPEEVTPPSNPNSSSQEDQNSEDNTSAFIPVPDTEKTQQLGNGKTFYCLVEYPKQSQLTRKKHAFDLDKFRGGQGWHCLCGMNFENQSLMKYHVKYFTAKWKFMCVVCSRKYPGMNFLKLHMLRTHKIMCNDQGVSGGNSGGNNGCSYCTKSFLTATELLRHLTKVHNKTLPNGIATQPGGENGGDVVATTSAEPSTSSGGGDGGQPVQKSVLVVNGTLCACGMEQGSKEGLLAHIREEVESQGQHFQCTMCQETFNHPCNMKSHFREKHGLLWKDYQERRYGCSWCDKMFAKVEEFEKHVGEEHTMDQQEGVGGLQQDALASFGDVLEAGSNASSSASGNSGNTITFHVDQSKNGLDASTAIGMELALQGTVVTAVIRDAPQIVTIEDD